MQPNEVAKGEQLNRNCRLMLVFAVWPSEVEEAPCNLLERPRPLPLIRRAKKNRNLD